MPSPHAPLLVTALLATSLAASAATPDRESTLRLPESVRQGNASYVEEVPQSDYRHASAAAHQAFRNMKYGVRIHWGLYSLLPHARESWTFLEQSDEERQKWLESHQHWNPTKFDADGWMKFFQRAGFQCFAITTKHHEGFSLWDTKTRVKQRPNFSIPGKPFIEPCDVAYSVMETPFKRDIIRELTDAGRRHGLKINLYFSHSDWYDVSFRPYGRHPIQNVSSKSVKSLEERQKRSAVLFPDPTPDEITHMMSRHREQLHELLTQYGKIDMLCLDIQLGGEVWPQLRETMKLVRQWQPDVMIRNRGIGNYGDYYTPERTVPSEQATGLPWMVIYPLGRNFSWEGEATQHKGAKWVVDNLVDSVAKGGNFMVGIGPNGAGEFHPEAIRQLEQVGAWLKVNGEAIWDTDIRRGDLWKEGEHVRFTTSRDGRHVYAVLLRKPDNSSFQLTSVAAKPGSEITLLGRAEPLAWRNENGVLTLELPALDDALAHVLRIETQSQSLSH